MYLSENLINLSNLEIIWKAGPHPQDILVHASPKLHLISDKKFSDYKYVLVKVKMPDDKPYFSIRKISEWIERSSKIERSRYLLTVYISDTIWKKNYGLFQLAGAGIQAIYGVNSIKEIKGE